MRCFVFYSQILQHLPKLFFSNQFFNKKLLQLACNETHWYQNCKYLDTANHKIYL